jgi:hypothetical protein
VEPRAPRGCRFRIEPGQSYRENGTGTYSATNAESTKHGTRESVPMTRQNPDERHAPTVRLLLRRPRHAPTVRLLLRRPCAVRSG